jgi:hypothetical protein
MERLEIESESKADAMFEAQKVDTEFSFMYSFKQKNPPAKVYVFRK